MIGGMECRAPPTERADVLLPPDEQRGEPMVLRPSAHNQLTAHRTAAKESRALMRATIADIEEIIQHSKKVIDDGREAMRRVDDLLQTKKPQVEP
jgi:hypothetical protein